MAILELSKAASVAHSFRDTQDIRTIQKALDNVILTSFEANMIIAFNEAHRLLNRKRKHRMGRVLVVASNGRYACKGKYQAFCSYYNYYSFFKNKNNVKFKEPNVFANRTSHKHKTFFQYG